MRDYKTSRFTKRIGITDDDLGWILDTKGKKSAAGRLEEIIAEARRPNLFKTIKAKKK